LSEIGAALLDIEKSGYKFYELLYVSDLVWKCLDEIREAEKSRECETEYAEWEMFYEGFCEILNNIVNKYERKNTKKTIESTTEITLF